MNLSSHETPANPVTLRFKNDETEAAFYDAYVQDSLPIIRWSLGLGFGLFAFFGILDVELVPDVIVEALTIRVIVCSFIAAGFWLSFSRYFKKGMQFIMSLVPFMAAVGVMIMILITDWLGGTYYYGGLIVIMMFVHVLSRLRFIYATVTGWLIVALFVAVSLVKDHPGYVIMNNTFVLVSAHMFGMFASYMLERYARQIFLQMNALGSRKRELEKANTELKNALNDLKSMQNQLVHSEKMASLGQLTAGIAHEIKNPLNFVTNFANLSEELARDLREALDTGQPHEDIEAIIDDLGRCAEKINEHGRRADRIVRNMLEHARFSAGNYETVEINHFVDEWVCLAQNELDVDFPKLEVTIERLYDPDAGEVNLAPQDMGRVLLNILQNAFYAAKQCTNTDAPPTVTIHTNGTHDDVEIRITDNGPGIPENIRHRVFEPFFTTKPAGEGTGLGLSLSYDIVTRAHGGTLQVESTVGEGTSFIITIPRFSKHISTHPPPQQTPPKTQRQATTP